MIATASRIGPAELYLREVGGEPDDWRLFNPAILEEGDGFILAFRLVGPSGRRDIGICRLDAALCVRPGSARLISRLLRLPPGTDTDWFADPRLYWFGGRLHLYWNSGWQQPVNHQFLAELDGTSLLPAGPALSIQLAIPERAIEKNWTFLGDSLDYAVYSPQPHRVVRLVERDARRLVFEEVHREEWRDAPFARRYAPLRGGAPPVRSGACYTSFCHCVVPTALGYRYFAAAYRFAAAPPFQLASLPTSVLGFARNDGRGLAARALNPVTEHVVYPSGAVRHGNDWLIAYGLNDAEARIARLTGHELEATQAPCHTPGQMP